MHCFWMPSVMSTWDRMQLTHMFDGLGWIPIPQRQQSLQRRSVSAAALRRRLRDGSLKASLTGTKQ